MATAKDCPPQALSERTLETYARDWALFADWCAATEEQELPALPDAVVDFLTDCPATPAAQRVRVAAIDHHHARAGLPRPGESFMVLAALGRPTGEPPDGPPDLPAAVESALRLIPSHGWTGGMFGRRDRCLLVLSQLAGVPYQHLAALTPGDIAFVDGAASVTSAAGAWTVAPDDNPVLCGPCAINRWIRVLDVVMTKPSHRVLAEQIKDADPVTDRSPHLCRSTRELSSLTLGVPLLPPIDQWGYVPFPLQRLTPHSLSRLVHQMLAGDFGAHRHIPVDDELPEPEQQAPVPVEARRVYGKVDSQRAWARRRADLEDIAGIDDVLAEIDARAKELDQRTAALLAQNTHEPHQRNP